MKNAIKKVVAVAMAFTLLGTGTTIAKTVNPKSVTTLSAHAACKNHVVDSSAYRDDKWGSGYCTDFLSKKGTTVYFKPVKCVRCGEILWYRKKTDYWKRKSIFDEKKVYKTEYSTDRVYEKIDLHNPFFDPMV